MLTAFYRAKLAALQRDASGRTLAALRELVREERRAAMRALAEKWALRRAAAQEVCRKQSRRQARRPDWTGHPNKFTKQHDNIS